jgi:peroxiredoxin
VEAIGRLQTVQDKYRDKGLVMVSLNIRDRKSASQEVLAKAKATFLNVIDDSPAADKLLYRDLQGLGPLMESVPLTYVIDRDGKVASAVYEIDPDKTLKSLEPLGIK